MIVSPSCAYNLKCRRFCISHGLGVALNSTEEVIFPQTQLHKDSTVGCKVATPLKR